MELFNFLNQNPALISIIAFPLGLILTLAVAQKYIFTGVSSKIEAWFNAYLAGFKQHTEAEVKIESRLSQLVDKIEDLIAHDWDTRRFFDSRFDHVSDFLKSMDIKLDNIMIILPKRREDPKNEKQKEKQDA